MVETGRTKFDIPVEFLKKDDGWYIQNGPNRYGPMTFLPDILDENIPQIMEALELPLDEKEDFTAQLFRTRFTVDKHEEKKEVVIVSNTRSSIVKYFTEKYLFYCDSEDPNLTIYVWTDNSWQPKSEAIFLKDLVILEKNFIKKPSITKDGLTDYFKGLGQNTEVIPKPANIISFINGNYNLNTVKLESHTPKYFIVNQIPHNLNPEAECPNWEEFLKQIHHEEDLNFVQEWWGYNLYSAYSSKAFVVMMGGGDNGKSVELTVIEHILGHKNITNATLQNINDYKGYHLAGLYHKLSNIADDIPANKLRVSGNLKIASDGGWLNARPIYGKPFDFKNYAKITDSCNEPPELVENSEAIWTRMKIIKFPYTFKPEPDLEKGELQARERGELEAELISETEGIINWMIQGLHRLINQKFKFSYNLSTEETQKYYKIKSNPCACFEEMCMVYTADDENFIMKKELHPLFKKWCIKKGIKPEKVQSSQKFFKYLKSAGVDAVQSKAMGMERIYRGYTCKIDDEGNKVTSNGVNEKKKIGYF